MDPSDVEDAENSRQHVLQVEKENPTSSWILSPTSKNNSPCSEKGLTGNFRDNDKRQDTFNASTGLLCSNSFDSLLKTNGKQVRLTENDNDSIQEKTSFTTCFEQLIKSRSSRICV